MPFRYRRASLILGVTQDPAFKAALQQKGISEAEARAQLEHFVRGVKPTRLLRPATVRDGIDTTIDEIFADDIGRYQDALRYGLKPLRMVPASGAASRMFEVLNKFLNEFQQGQKPYMVQGRFSYPAFLALSEEGLTDNEKADRKFLKAFIGNLKAFALWPHLQFSAQNDDIDLAAELEAGFIENILLYLLTDKGIDCASQPKAFLEFHRYADGSVRTAMEEQLREAAALEKDAQGVVRVHFTISPEHEAAFVTLRDGLIKNLQNELKLTFEITHSFQSPATDTIAVGMDNQPFRKKDGSFLFRAGGHGALIKNLNDLPLGNVVFIKNVDNVQRDEGRADTVQWKQALAGVLIHAHELRDELLDDMEGWRMGRKLNEENLLGTWWVARDELGVKIEDSVWKGLSNRKRYELLKQCLDRPIRVCGMVKNEGEPGGGPYWVRHADGSSSLQIVEKDEMDKNDAEQMALVKAATHFNPVDLVVCLTRPDGGRYDLTNYVDNDRWFMAQKSVEGTPIKALERPGLWNGGSGKWLTIFVEVPLTTFSPVKTINDLARPEHRTP